MSSGRPDDPQTWNRYSYVLNNPLGFLDPLGLFEIDANLSSTQQQQIRDAYDALETARTKLKAGSKAYAAIDRALKRLGKPGVKNGITVTIGATKDPDALAETDVNRINKGAVTITFNQATFANEKPESRAGDLGHEGVHADDAFNLFASSRNMNSFLRAWESNRYQTEYNAKWADAGSFEVLAPQNLLYGPGYYTPPTQPGKAQNIPMPFYLWNPSWATLDRQTIEAKQSEAIKTILEAPKSTKWGYQLKPPKNFKP